MPDPETPSTPSQEDAMRALQLEKLEMEVKSLARSPRKEMLSTLTPLISACVTVAALLLATNQYFAQQAKDRAERDHQQALQVKAQIRRDLEQILALPKDADRSAKIVFLLADLDGLTESLPEERKRITNVLISFVRDDADFDNVRDAFVEIAAINGWKPYADYLETATLEHDYVLYKYFQALRHLHDLSPAYFETVEYNPDLGFEVRAFVKEPLYARFITLVRGFACHMTLSTTGQRQRAKKRFQNALNNQKLSGELFGGPGDAFLSEQSYPFTRRLIVMRRNEGSGSTKLLKDFVEGRSRMNQVAK